MSTFKLDRRFPDSQFKIDGYQFPLFRKDRDSKDGGKILFVRESNGAKRFSHYESPSIESFCIELTISKRKWCILFAYCPPNLNKGEFFKEISNTLSKALKCYDNIVLAGDLNIDLLDPSKGTSNYLLDVFNLKNLVKEPTCFMSDEKSLIDIVLTNKSSSFHKRQGFVTGISDFQKLVVTVYKRPYYKKLLPKNFLYRNVKRFEKTTFLRDLDSRLIQGDLYNNCQEPYNKLT